MKTLYLLLFSALIFPASISAHADSSKSGNNNQHDNFSQCIVVKPLIINGNDLNSSQVVPHKRVLHIPKGWTIIGTAAGSDPLIFMCK